MSFRSTSVAASLLLSRSNRTSNVISKGVKLLTCRQLSQDTTINNSNVDVPSKTVGKSGEVDTFIRDIDGQKGLLAPISGIPEEHVSGRYVRIYRPAKNAMQSGTAGVRRWKIDFENRERYENSLMGWASSDDPMSNTQLDFASKEDAILFVEKNGWPFWVEDPKDRAPKAKSYALNFSWNRRTRKSTK